MRSARSGRTYYVHASDTILPFGSIHYYIGIREKRTKQLYISEVAENVADDDLSLAVYHHRYRTVVRRTIHVANGRYYDDDWMTTLRLK